MSPSPRLDNICWLSLPSRPFELSWYFSIRGAENFHIYLWITKDLAWTQGWYYVGYTFGSLAIAWSAYLLSHAISHRSINEIWASIAQIMWLFGNMWWMVGELHDIQYPDADPWYEKHTIEAGRILESALCFLAIFYLIVKPFNLCPPSEEAKQAYNDTGLQCRFTWLFGSWRDYENIHILFWLGKDTAWNISNPAMWIIFVFPTVLIAFDFVFVTMFTKYMVIEHAHYLAQLLWVFANLVWAFGEVFYPAHDSPYSLLDVNNRSAEHTFRWYCSWVLFGASLPLITMYGLWVLAYAKGAIRKGLSHQQLETDEVVLSEQMNAIEMIGHLPLCSPTNLVEVVKQSILTTAPVSESSEVLEDGEDVVIAGPAYLRVDHDDNKRAKDQETEFDDVELGLDG